MTQNFDGKTFSETYITNANGIGGFDYNTSLVAQDVAPVSNGQITYNIEASNGQATFIESTIDYDNADSYQDAIQNQEAKQETFETHTAQDTYHFQATDTAGKYLVTDTTIIDDDSKNPLVSTYSAYDTGYSDNQGTIFYIPGISGATNLQDGNAGTYLKFLNSPVTPTVLSTDTTTLSSIPTSDSNSASAYASNYTSTATLSGTSFNAQQYDTPADPSACFVSGTHILTSEGEVCVENLQVGDLLVTASGALRPIKWIGSHHIHRMPQRATLAAKLVWPIRITQNAFAPDVPNRDLLVSPGHALAVDVMGLVFIQAEKLVNGTTIRQEPCSSLTYWHVELETHDVIISNNLTSESYLDVGNRAVLGLASSSAPATLADYAYPLIENGPVIKAIRARLEARAQTLGWHQTQNDDMHLLVDGQRLEPVTSDKRVCFIFPTSAQNVQLVSHTFSPAECSGSNDHRHLGVNMSDVQLADGFRCSNTLSLDHPVIANQFHVEEARDGATWRWTQGLLKLEPSLWAECKGHVIFTFIRHTTDGKYWSAPVGKITNVTEFRKKA